jgi:hypothetical protein
MDVPEVPHVCPVKRAACLTRAVECVEKMMFSFAWRNELVWLKKESNTYREDREVDFFGSRPENYIEYAFS